MRDTFGLICTWSIGGLSATNNERRIESNGMRACEFRTSTFLRIGMVNGGEGKTKKIVEKCVDATGRKWKCSSMSCVALGKNNQINHINLTDERTFFMDFCSDDCTGTGNGRLNLDSDVFGSSCKSQDLRLIDDLPPRIGDKLGGGKMFKWFGVNERRLPSDVMYGDRNFDDGIGDNGNNGEFGVWTLVYIDIVSFFFVFYRLENVYGIFIWKL